MEMSSIAIILIVVIIVFLLRRSTKSIENRAYAVFDSFNAKAIYDRLSDKEKDDLVHQTIELLVTRGLEEKFARDFLGKEDIMKYCYIAYTLSSKGKNPLPEGESWHLIDKPGLALLNNETEVALKVGHAKKVFKESYGLEVNIG